MTGPTELFWNLAGLGVVYFLLATGTGIFVRLVAGWKVESGETTEEKTAS